MCLCLRTLKILGILGTHGTLGTLEVMAIPPTPLQWELISASPGSVGTTVPADGRVTSLPQPL